MQTFWKVSFSSCIIIIIFNKQVIFSHYWKGDKEKEEHNAVTKRSTHSTFCADRFCQLSLPGPSCTPYPVPFSLLYPSPPLGLFAYLSGYVSLFIHSSFRFVSLWPSVSSSSVFRYVYINHSKIWDDFEKEKKSISWTLLRTSLRKCL